MNEREVLIDATALAALPPHDVLIVDCRFGLADPGKGERDFLDAHIPGAVYASLDRDLSDLSKQGLGRHPLPDVEAFAGTLTRWGWRTACCRRTPRWTTWSSSGTTRRREPWP